MSPNHITDGSDSSGSDYEPKLPLTSGMLELLEESPRGDVYSFGATPLDNINNLVQQSEAFKHLRTLAQYRPDDVPQEIGTFVYDTFRSRFINRGEANDENFTTRIVQDYETQLEPVFVEMVDRAKTGHASPAELMLVRDLLGIRSIELASLTHPYGEIKGFSGMSDVLAEMRNSINYGIALFDGESFNPPTDTRFKVKEIVGEEDGNFLIDGKSPGLLMTRKHKIGELPDGTIIRERSSFILRIDPKSTFYKMIGAEKIEELKAIQKLPGNRQGEALAEFQAKIAVLLEMDEFEQAIPVSSTIYAFNKATKAEVIRLEAQRTEDNQTFFEEHNLPIVDEQPIREVDITAHREVLERAVANVRSDLKFLAEQERRLKGHRADDVSLEE